jgi:RNA polymerase sigma factor (TIGR02999 family)
MPQPSSGEVTGLLRAWGDGDRGALDRLVPLVYAHLRDLAHLRLLGEPAGVSVNTTALVHEAYIRLVGIHSTRFRDRAHFLAMASRAMRRILVDHARARMAAKRGDGAVEVDLREDLLVDEGRTAAVTELDAALVRLEALDERQARILEQRYFGGLSLEETAEATGVSLATVKRELRFARAWLAAELGADALDD